MTIKMDMVNSGVRRAMLPGFGFFGTTWADRLQLDVFARITDIVVSRPGEKTMDLKGIRVLKADGADPFGHRVTTSAAGADADVAQDSDLFKISPVHASSDDAAYWWLHFDEPTPVRRVLIFNSGGWQNLDLVVTATRDDGTELQLRDPSSDRDLTSVLATLAKYDKADTLFQACATEEDARIWRERVVGEVCTSIRAGAMRPSMDEALRIASLIPITGELALTDDDYFLIAYLLMAQTARNEASRSGWAAFRQVFPSRTHLRKLEGHFAEAAELLQIPRRSLTRHGLVQASKLADETPAIADLAVELRRDLSRYGLTPLIAYGSLLGHVREGHLLEHDDDFDSMVCLTAPSRADFDDERAAVVDKLRADGWEVKLNGKYWNVHVSKPGPAHIDMFFVHVEDGRAYTHMERMRVRDVPAEWLEPGQIVTVDGIEMAIPREPEKFLEDRYGSGWTVADPYADWPWALAD
jgi:hypothetical protein